MKIAVLYGGSSSERDVSLRSGQAVADALTTNGHSVILIDTQKGIASLAKDIAGSDVVFPVLHGQGGEDGTIQQELDQLGVPYVGSGPAASLLCYDKWLFKEFMRQHMIPTPDGEIVTEDSFWESSLISSPFVLKPRSEGSSIDMLIIRDPNRIDRKQIKATFAQNSELLLEEMINGTEITVGVLEETALPVIEIIPPKDSEYDYENKYNGKTQVICPPQHVDERTQALAQTLAEQIHILAECSDMSRTDMIISKHNEIYVLETNTIPGMTKTSHFPKAANASGITMADLVERLAISASTVYN